MSPRDKLLLYILAVFAGGFLIAVATMTVIELRRKGRETAARRYADLRFSPTDEEIEERNTEYARYEAPTYLRTRAEEARLMQEPGLRRQAS